MRLGAGKSSKGKIAMSIARASIRCLSLYASFDPIHLSQGGTPLRQSGRALPFQPSPGKSTVQRF